MKLRALLVVLFFVNNASYAEDYKTGEFNISATPKDLLEKSASDSNQIIDENANLSWEIYVPESYDPGNPPGIMVFAGAPSNVRPPMGWLDTMKEKNLIWVAARKSDNGSSISQKVLLAMMSVALIEKNYTINNERIYITGDGRTAGRTTLDYPQIFKGAIFTGDRIWEDNAENKVSNIKDHRFVFVTKEKTIFPKGNRYAYNKFKDAGVTNSIILVIQNNHRYDRPKFSKSIDYLDG